MGCFLVHAVCVLSNHLRIFISCLPAAARPPRSGQPSREPGCAWESARGPWVWEWGALPGELPPAVGRAPGGSWLVARVWAGNVKHTGRFPWAQGRPGHCLQGLSPPAMTVRGRLARRTFAKVAPGECSRIRPGGSLLVKGCPRHLCRVAVGGPEHPSIQVVAGWPIHALLGHSAWRLFTACQ